MTRLHHILAVIVTLMLALPAIDAQKFAPAAQAQVVMVTGDNVNLRVGPGLDYSRITKVDKGTVLPYNYSIDEWYSVNFDGRNLYIHQDYCKYYDSIDSIENQEAQAPSQYVVVTGDGVRLRTGPGLNHDVKAKVNKGARLHYVSTHDKWFCVEYEGKKLYISSDYAKIER